MRLVLVRHAETIENVSKINCGGRSEGHLSEYGYLQANKLAKFLKDFQIDKIYVSPRRRTKHTIDPLLKKGVVCPEYTEEIRERDLGVYDGLPHGSFAKGAEKEGIFITDFKPKGSETITESYVRASNFLRQIIKYYSDKTVLVVTHGGIMLQMHFFLLQIPFYEREKNAKILRPKNTAVSMFEIDENGKTKNLFLNSIKHLD